MQNMIPITTIGAENLREELHRLKKVDRPRVIASISEARAHGDLKENAEYHAAREEQGFIEGRIGDIESKLAHCRVIDISQLSNDGKVVFSSTVTLLNLDDDVEKTYQIVGIDEADLKQGKISVTSPLARALIGKHMEEVVGVDTPQGHVEYEIIKVEYL
jgi:transcription elongation factor GreA